MIIPGLSDTYVAERPVHLTEDLSTDGLIDGRYVGQDGSKLDFLTITAPVDMDAIQAEMAFITVTQPVDLDQMELDIASLSAAITLQGTWDMSGNLYPVSTKAGDSWIVTVAGTAGGVSFEVNDRVVALIDGASQANSTHWHKLDYTDEVLSVAGKTGAVTLLEADITDLQDYLLEVDIDSLSKLNAIVGESLLTAETLAVTAWDVITFNPVADPVYAPGVIWYSNAAGGGWRGYVEEADITANFMEEQWVTVRNDTGVTIPDGTPVHIVGWAAGIAQVEPIIANGFRVIGLVTHSIEPGTVGKATTSGRLTGPDYTSFSAGDTLYVSTSVAGEVTNVVPLWPLTAIELGVVADNSNPGSMNVDIEHHGNKNVIIKSYNFSSRDVTSGIAYLGGFYDFPATDMNLSQASPTQVVGAANVGYGAHVAVVFGAASTDGSTITLTATGTSHEPTTGVSTPADSEVLYTGAVGGLTLNEYIESTKHWVGEVTLTLTSDGVNFTLDANYGLTQYEDVSTIDLVVRAVDVAGLCNNTDVSFNLELLHHESAGWTYAATGFVPGSAVFASYVGDYGSNSKILGGSNFSWKRFDILETILAGVGEGLLLRVTTSTNNAISFMNAHITGAAA
jgi:hypothetical protein